MGPGHGSDTHPIDLRPCRFEEIGALFVRQQIADAPDVWPEIVIVSRGRFSDERFEL